MTIYPKIPDHLSTIRSGNRQERWRERRAILIAQRDIRQRWYARMTELLCEGAPVTWARKSTGSSIATLNARIQECNDTLDAMGTVDQAAFLRPRRENRRARGG